MLVAFHVENYKSFKERASLLMEPAKLKEHPENCHTLTLAEKAYPLLNSAVIYGPNASGKSTLIEALGLMRNWILNPGDSTENIPTEPFLLEQSYEEQPSTFISEFFVEGVLYEYGFVVSPHEVVEEWLNRTKKRKQVLFHRKGDSFLKIAKDIFPNADNILKSTHTHRLFLKTADLFKNDVTQLVLQWFQGLRVTSSLNLHKNQEYTRDEFLKSQKLNTLLLEFIQLADFGIEYLRDIDLVNVLEKLNSEHIEELAPYVSQRPLIDLFTERSVRSENGIEKALWPIYKESQGTQQYFSLAGPVLDALLNAKVLVIDELDVRLHPHLIAWVVELFHRANTGAQLIFVSQNPYLLNAELMRQDQIWFVEKDKQGASQLYSLVEFRSESKRAQKITAYQQDYLYGRYGALPHLGSVDRILERIANIKNAQATDSSLVDREEQG
jgi:AAA15 family ATPase/GTPase